jgi:hypothetical protein
MGQGEGTASSPRDSRGSSESAGEVPAGIGSARGRPLPAGGNREGSGAFSRDWVHPREEEGQHSEGRGPRKGGKKKGPVAMRTPAASRFRSVLPAHLRVHDRDGSRIPHRAQGRIDDRRRPQRHVLRLATLPG